MYIICVHDFVSHVTQYQQKSVSQSDSQSNVLSRVYLGNPFPCFASLAVCVRVCVCLTDSPCPARRPPPAAPQPATEPSAFKTSTWWLLELRDAIVLSASLPGMTAGTKLLELALKESE
jgi:hypothetical protein